VATSATVEEVKKRPSLGPANVLALSRHPRHPEAHPEWCGNLVTPPARTREQHRRDDRGAQYMSATEIESRKQEEERVRQENVRLEERTRIARELHDTLLQTVQSASLHLAAALLSDVTPY
jgi:signal transduction histidine kinase